LLLTTIACDACTARDAALVASGQPGGYGAGAFARTAAAGPFVGAGARAAPGA